MKSLVVAFDAQSGVAAEG